MLLWLVLAAARTQRRHVPPIYANEEGVRAHYRRGGSGEQENQPAIPGIHNDRAPRRAAWLPFHAFAVTRQARSSLRYLISAGLGLSGAAAENMPGVPKTGRGREYHKIKDAEALAVAKAVQGEGILRRRLNPHAPRLGFVKIPTVSQKRQSDAVSICQSGDCDMDIINNALEKTEMHILKKSVRAANAKATTWWASFHFNGQLPG